MTDMTVEEINEQVVQLMTTEKMAQKIEASLLKRGILIERTKDGVVWKRVG